MIYDSLKITHIIAASLFTGSLFMSCLLTFYLQTRVQKMGAATLLTIVRRIEIPTILITTILLPVTGFSMIHLKNINFLSTWIIGSIVCFVAIIIHRLESWYHQNNARPTRLIRLIVLFFIVLTLYYLMTNQPS